MGAPVSRIVWLLLGALVLALVIGVLLLDRRQAQRGAPSVFALPWARLAPGTAAGPSPVPSAGAPGPPLHRPPPAPTGWRGPARGVGRVAVLVDELGARLDVFEQVVAMGQPLSVAVLPELPLSRRIAREAQRAGLEVLLQLPLEPYRYPALDPGPGTLLTAMPPEEIRRRTRQYLASVPGVAGVVTHMGSRFTEDRGRMSALLETVRGEGRFFVDGLTTQRSVGYDLARTLGLPAARRQITLDPEGGEAGARARLEAVERWVERRGAVVVVGHGRLLTVHLLAQALPRWEARGLRLVPVSALVDGRSG